MGEPHLRADFHRYKPGIVPLHNQGYRSPIEIEGHNILTWRSRFLLPWLGIPFGLHEQRDYIGLHGPEPAACRSGG